MKNGATIMLETSWAINTEAVIREGSCRLCGSKAGLSILNDELIINKVELDRLVVAKVDLSAGGVAFYSGSSATPHALEARQWIESIVDDKAPCVLPEQAYVVSQILEAIYTSSKTGKAVYFE